MLANYVHDSVTVSVSLTETVFSYLAQNLYAFLPEIIQMILANYVHDIVLLLQCYRLTFY